MIMESMFGIFFSVKLLSEHPVLINELLFVPPCSVASRENLIPF